MTTTTINIPLEIPTALIDAGGIERYAREYAGWKPTIIEIIQGEDVDDSTGVEVVNPETAQEACMRYIRDIVKEDYRKLMVREGKKAGEKQAIDQFNEAFE